MDALHLETVAKSVIEQTMLRLPENIRFATEACAIEIAYIKECHTSGEALESDLLGLFEGRCHSDAESEHVDDLPRVRLFLDNIWDYAEHDRTLFSDEVRLTLLHELGHYFGLNESQVEALGLA